MSSDAKECAPLSSANLKRLELAHEHHGESLNGHRDSNGMGSASHAGDVDHVVMGLSGLTLDRRLPFYSQKTGYVSDSFDYHDASNSPTRSERGPSKGKKITRSAELPMSQYETPQAENLRDLSDHGEDLETILPNASAHPLRAKPSNISGRHQIGGVDAQGVYPPAACIFIANLPENKDDVALEAALYKVFSMFGTCFMKIRRDNKKMPFAFCQYTRIEDAQEAMEHGKGSEIFGRPCRVEVTKGNRTFIIYKRNGDITLDEAREVLKTYGRLSQCYFMKQDALASLNIRNAAVFVEFQMYDEERDLYTAFRRQKVYVVNSYDPKKISQSSRDHAETFLRQFETDRRSAFVGNLPLDVDEEELGSVFSEVGDIQNIQVIRKPLSAGPSTRAFAFIEYVREDLPDIAIERFDNVAALGAQPLRVERKVGRELLRSTPQARRIRSRPSMRFKSPEERQHNTEERRFTPKNTTSGTDQGVVSPPVPMTGHTPSTLPATPSYGMMAYPAATGQPYVPYAAPGVADALVNTPETTPTVPMQPLMNPSFYYWPGLPYYADPSTGRVFSAVQNNTMGNVAMPYEDPFSTPPQHAVPTSHPSADHQDHESTA